jgi:hypothetical protein
MADGRTTSAALLARRATGSTARRQTIDHRVDNLTDPANASTSSSALVIRGLLLAVGPLAG